MSTPYLLFMPHWPLITQYFNIWLCTVFLRTHTQSPILPVRSSVMLYKYPLTDFVSMPWLPGKAATPPLGVPAEMPHWLRTLV